jgi:hypothetical protein
MNSSIGSVQFRTPTPGRGLGTGAFAGCYDAYEDSMDLKNKLDVLGEMLVKQLRDRALKEADKIITGVYKRGDMVPVHEVLEEMSQQQIDAVATLVRSAVDHGLHDLCLALSDDDCPVRVIVEGDDLGAESDGLHGEVVGKKGWIVKFSAYPPTAGLVLPFNATNIGLWANPSSFAELA